MDVLFGSRNRGKLIEVSEALGELTRLRTPGDLGIDGDPDEPGETFAQNAAAKARFYHQRSGFPTLADDSGIIVDALAGELGIRTRRWGAGPDASDAEWIAYFLKRMEREDNRRASFVCALAFIDAHGREHLFEGRCDGVITPTLEADYLPGLPISACFKPDGFHQVYTALSVEQKNRTSHRGRALLLLREYLKGL